MQEKYIPACTGKFAGVQNKRFGFEHLLFREIYQSVWKTQHETEDKEIQTLSKT